jgi:hypothetical protein
LKFHPSFSVWLGNPGPCSDQPRQICPVIGCDAAPSCRCEKDAPGLGPDIGDIAFNRPAVASEQSVEFIGDERLAGCCRGRRRRRRRLRSETGRRRRGNDPGDHDSKSPGHNPVRTIPELDHLAMRRRVSQNEVPAASIWDHQRAWRRWLTGRSKARTRGKIARIWNYPTGDMSWTTSR